MSDEARAGLALFTSNRLGCSSCHASFTFSGPTQDREQQSPSSFHHTGVGGSAQKFRAPTLRAVRHTAPYMHAGQLATLKEVIKHYEQTASTEVPDFTLTAMEQKQLIAFLRAL